MKYFAILILLMIQSCTTPYQVKELPDNEFEAKGKATNGDVGLNNKRQVIIHKETSLVDELRVQEMVNTNLQDQVNSAHYELGHCRKDISDPRLGGNGRLTPLPGVDDMKSDPKVREEVGLDKDGDLKVVREEFFQERLKAEQKYEKTLRKMLATLEEHRDDCQRNLTQARLKAGLPGQAYKADGYFTKDGTWVEAQHGENSLDDAFEINAKAKTKAAH